MGSNVLPFALRRTVAAPSRPAAARLIVVSKAARLLLTVAPRRRG